MQKKKASGVLHFTHALFHPPVLLSQFDRTKKPSVRVLNDPKSSQNGSAKDSLQNGPLVPDRSVKPSLIPNNSLSKEEQSQIHSEAVAGMEKAKQEQEKRNQERRVEEEKREKDQKERLEKEQSEKRTKENEDDGPQEKKKLERQKAEEEEDKENSVWDGKERRGKEQNSDTPTKSMSLDSPAPNHVVNEIKVSPLFFQCFICIIWYFKGNTNIQSNQKRQFEQWDQRSIHFINTKPINLIRLFEDWKLRLASPSLGHTTLLSYLKLAPHTFLKTI